MNILFLYWIYIKSMHISHYGFVCPVNFSNVKYIWVKKKKFLENKLREKIYQVFVNYSRILPIWQILYLFLFASFGIHELLLFHFVQKLATRIYSYSFSRENYYLLITVYNNLPMPKLHSKMSSSFPRLSWEETSPIVTWTISQFILHLGQACIFSDTLSGG